MKSLRTVFLAEKKVFKTNSIYRNGRTLTEPVFGKAIKSVLSCVAESIPQIQSNSIETALYNGESGESAKVFRNPSAEVGFNVEACFENAGCIRLADYITNLKEDMNNASKDRPVMLVAAFYSTKAYRTFCSCMKGFVNNSNTAVIILLYNGVDDSAVIGDMTVSQFITDTFDWYSFESYLKGIKADDTTYSLSIKNVVKSELNTPQATFAYGIYDWIKTIAESISHIF